MTEEAPFHIVDSINAHAASGKPFIAFEYFPPRTADGVTNLYARIERMALQKPLYCDVTWGAGGGTSELTLELCTESKRRFGVNMNMHLTWCVGSWGLLLLPLRLEESWVAGGGHGCQRRSFPMCAPN